MLIIFTPVFNRKVELTRLYNSLKAQTNLAFKWLIVDDSSDIPLESLVKKWQKYSCYSLAPGKDFKRKSDRD